MSHHYSGPDVSFPHGDARLDLTDLYAFPKPRSSDKSILIMNVHPSTGFNPQGPTRQDPFAPDALYEIKIDTNGDAVADITYGVRSSSGIGCWACPARSWRCPCSRLRKSFATGSGCWQPSGTSLRDSYSELVASQRATGERKPCQPLHWRKGCRPSRRLMSPFGGDLN